VFIGVGGHVVTLDPATGAELWRSKVKSSPFVTVSLSPNGLLAGSGGEVFCLDPASGSVL
jgi:outer membrane protein assembly factor BamB